jgi:hypothetical protein
MKVNSTIVTYYFPNIVTDAQLELVAAVKEA